LINNNI
jgi:hypothetical protein